jgi:hypothetical protein
LCAAAGTWLDPGEPFVAEALVTSQRPVREAIVTEMRALRADRG